MSIAYDTSSLVHHILPPSVLLLSHRIRATLGCLLAHTEEIIHQLNMLLLLCIHWSINELILFLDTCVLKYSIIIAVPSKVISSSTPWKLANSRTLITTGLFCLLFAGCHVIYMLDALSTTQYKSEMRQNKFGDGQNIVRLNLKRDMDHQYHMIVN